MHLFANWKPKPFLYLDIYSVNPIEVTLDNELLGHDGPAKLTDFSLGPHLRRLDLMVVLLMVGTIVLMIDPAILVLGSIVPLILMRMIVVMIRSYMLIGSALPVRPGLTANIKRRWTLRRLCDLHLVDV